MLQFLNDLQGNESCQYFQMIIENYYENYFNVESENGSPNNWVVKGKGADKGMNLVNICWLQSKIIMKLF